MNFGIKHIESFGFDLYAGGTNFNEDAHSHVFSIEEVNPDKCVVILNGGISLMYSSGMASLYVFLPYLFSIFPTSTSIKIDASSFNGFSGAIVSSNIRVLSNRGSCQIIEYY